jgi:hypothetical protein
MPKFKDIVKTLQQVFQEDNRLAYIAAGQTPAAHKETTHE